MKELKLDRETLRDLTAREQPEIRLNLIRALGTPKQVQIQGGTGFCGSGLCTVYSEDEVDDFDLTAVDCDKTDYHLTFKHSCFGRHAHLVMTLDMIKRLGEFTDLGQCRW